MVAVNASWGLGIAVVSGEVTPDDFLVSKITGEVVRRTVSPKPVEYAPDPEGRGTVRRDVSDDRREAACLDDDALAELVQVARRVESHFGGRHDIVWAIARGTTAPEGLFVLQSRPVTAATQTAPSTTGVSAMSLVLNTFGASRDRDEGAVIRPCR